MDNLTIKAPIEDLLWLRERIHNMRHNYEKQHNPKHGEMIARLTRLIDGLTIGTEKLALTEFIERASRSHNPPRGSAVPNFGTVKQLNNDSRGMCEQLKAHADFDVRQFGWRLSANLESVDRILGLK